MPQHLIFARANHSGARIHSFQVEGESAIDAAFRFASTHPGMVAWVAPMRLVEE